MRRTDVFEKAGLMLEHREVDRGMGTWRCEHTGM
jgi:hypothetical protein